MPPKADPSSVHQPDGADERPTYLDFTEGELLELAQGTLQAVLAATAKHLRASGGDLSAWVTDLGEAFAGGWDEPEPWTPGELLDAVAVNLRALGAEIVELDASGEPATMRTSGFPDRELCRRLGVSPDDVLRYNDTLVGLAQERGVEWSWRSDGEETVYAAASLPERP